ncbi:MAG: glycosyltransferase [Thermodesulfobacteriota bacterium]
MKVMMVEGTNLDSPIKVSCHHYARLFSERGDEVFYLSPSVSPFHLMVFRRLGDTFLKFMRWLKYHSGNKSNNGILEYIPLVPLPIHNSFVLRSNFVLQNSLSFSIPPLKKVLERAGFLKPDVLILSQITMHQVFDMVDAKVKIYRAADDITEFDQVPTGLVDIERRIVKKANLVITTAKRLVDRFSKIRTEGIFYLPNGVELDLFRIGKEELPQEYHSIKGLRVIYVGSVEYWFDEDLIAFLAENLKEVSFIIIGPLKRGLTRLKEYRNVHILGRRPYKKLPGYLNNSHIAIIPFKRDKMIESVCPVKLFEYMACGLPVVSTRWSEMEALKSPACLASSPEEFLEKLKYLLENHYNTDKGEFLEFARNNSWKKRFNILRKIIDGKLR